MQPSSIRGASAPLPKTPTVTGSATAQARSEAALPAGLDAMGLMAVGSFLAGHGLAGPQAAVLGELFTQGALRPAALPAAGDLPALRQLANALLPDAAALGPVGEAMARTAADLLLDADAPADLLAGGGTRSLVAEMLPRHLAETLTAGQPAAIARAAEDFLLTGTLSREAYEGLGSGGLLDLAGLLDGNREALAPALEPWGQEALSDGVGALAAAATAPGGYDGFLHAMVAATPAATRPYFAAQAAGRTETFGGAKGDVRLENGGVTADGAFGARAQATYHGEVQGDLTTAAGHTTGKGQLDAQAKAWAGGDGAIHGDKDGLDVQAQLGAGVEAEAKVQGQLHHDLIPGLADADLQGMAYAKAQAAAYVKVDGNVGYDEKGNVEAYVGIDAKAVAEVEAGATGGLTVNFFGFKITGGGYAKAKAGVGVEANAAGGYKDGKFFASAGAGTTAKVGQEAGGFMSVELPDWARGLVNGVAKLPGGQAAIGAAGQAMGAVVNAAHGIK